MPGVIRESHTIPAITGTIPATASGIAGEPSESPGCHQPAPDKRCPGPGPASGLHPPLRVPLGSRPRRRQTTVCVSGCRYRNGCWRAQAPTTSPRPGPASSVRGPASTPRRARIAPVRAGRSSDHPRGYGCSRSSRRAGAGPRPGHDPLGGPRTDAAAVRPNIPGWLPPRRRQARPTLTASGRP